MAAPRSLLPAFLLCSCWVLAGGSSSSPLSCASHCHRSNDTFTCPDTTAAKKYTVTVLPRGGLRFQCQMWTEVVNYLLFQDCKFSLVDSLEFLGCSLPNISFGEVALRLGIDPLNITTLSFTGDNNTDGQLENWHLVGLTNLKHLEMKENYFTNIPPNIFASTPQLVRIDLSSNVISDLPVNLFASLTKLTNLIFQNNILQELRPGLFNNNVLLESLNFNNNNLSAIQQNMFKTLESIKELNLKGNNLKELPPLIFYNLEYLETLDLSSNNLSFLSKEAFSRLRRLKSLNLGNNSLKDLHDYSFTNCVSLNTLYLNNNQLQEIKLSSFPFHQTLALQPLTYLDLSHNNISYNSSSSFPLRNQVNLKHLILNNNRFEAVPHAVTLFLKLETLELSDNLIEIMGFSSLYFANSFVKLGLKNNRIREINLCKIWAIHQQAKRVVELSLEGNAFPCDCSLYKLATAMQGTPLEDKELFNIIFVDADKTTCTNAQNEIQKIMDVRTETLTCQLPDLEHNCSWDWRPYDRTYLIDCSYKDLKVIPVFNLSSYTNHFCRRNYAISLDLRNNSITNFNGLQDPSYMRLTNLTIPNNKVSFINESLLPKSLKVLNVRGNNLTTLTTPLLQHFNATDLNLSLGNNPWMCNCDLIDFLNFLHVPSRKVDDFDDIRCKDEDEPLMSVSENSLCPFFMQPMVIVTIVAILIVLILFAVLGTVSFYKYKQGIKVWLFTHHMCLWAITEDEMDADKKYDAFISYSHKDEEFVNKVLVPGLESGDPKYRICLHYRDWIPGEYIQNQIMQSVEASRRTIVVLSSNFIESVWGQLEFKAAHSQALQDRTNRIIIIAYGEIPPEGDLDEKLQLYVSMKTYVKWGDAKFWEKLRYIMPHPQEFTQKHRKRCDTDKLELCKSDSK